MKSKGHRFGKLDGMDINRTLEDIYISLSDQPVSKQDSSYITTVSINGRNISLKASDNGQILLDEYNVGHRRINSQILRRLKHLSN